MLTLKVWGPMPEPGGCPATLGLLALSVSVGARIGWYLAAEVRR